MTLVDSSKPDDFGNDIFNVSREDNKKEKRLKRIEEINNGNF